MCRSILSISKIAHQVWRDHLISQRSMTIERAVGMVVGGDKEVTGVDKIFLKSGQQYRGG